MSIVAEIEQQRIDAKAAFLAGDFETALTIATVTLGDLALIPDGEKSGDAGAKLSWDREAIQAFIKMVQERRNDASIGDPGKQGGIAVSQVQYTRDCS